MHTHEQQCGPLQPQPQPQQPVPVPVPAHHPHPRLQQHGTTAYPAASPPPRTPATSTLHSFPTLTRRQNEATPAVSGPVAAAHFPADSRSHVGRSDADDEQQQRHPLLRMQPAVHPADALQSAYSSRTSGGGAVPVDSIKQRRVGSVEAASPQRARVAEEAYDGDKPHPITGRKIVRVSAARRNRGSWATEMRTMMTSVLGQPRHKNGRINVAFWGKFIMSIALLAVLATWLMTSRAPKMVPVPVTPAHVLTAPIAHAALSSVGPHAAGAGHAHTSKAERPPLTNSDVTIFTVYTPEQDVATGGPEHNVHLRAIYSWALRVAHPGLVHVYVRDYAHCASVQSLGVTCRVSGCWDEEFNAPLLTCMLGEANRRATTELMLYADDHLILFEDALPALLRVGRLERFLMLGRSQPLLLQLDSELDLETWQRDLESALFLDSSSEQQHDLLGQVALEERPAVRESKSLHYLAYAREDLDLAVLPAGLLMDGGAFLEHSWESNFLAAMLVQDRVHVVDASAAVTAIEFGHADHSNHTALLNAHNKATASNFTGLAALQQSATLAESLSHLSLGRLENAHYVLTGRCPTCLLKENREADLPLILLRKSNQHRQVIVIATNADYLALTFNWICRAQQLGVHNFVFLAEDRVSYRILRKMNVAAVLRKDAPYRKAAAATGSRAFQETLYLRALFFHQVVTLGFSLVMTHLDTVWFQDPLEVLERQYADCDMCVQMEKTGGSSSSQRSSGGIMSIRANAVGQAFVADYLLCEQENWSFMQQYGKTRFSFSDDADMDCVELISTRLMRRNNLRRCVLDPARYVSERDFFDLQLPQRMGVWPLFVHLNQANGVRNKTASFQGWHLWAVDDDAMLTVPRIRDAQSHGELHCVAPQPTLPPPEEHQQQNMHVIVHLLCSTEFRGMELTLVSLASARYESGVHIDLSITQQQPEEESDANSAAYLKVQMLIEQFEWKHGTKTLLVLDRFVGATDRWIDKWRLRPNNDAFLLVLRAGQILSPYWMTWTTQALNHYYFDPFTYDPQLMGISLVHQLSIVGETPSARYGSRVPSQVLAAAAATRRAQSAAAAANSTSSSGSASSSAASSLPTHHLYLYQLVPLTGSLFFPRHFSAFLQWYLVQNTSDPAVACVPTLISNVWWRTDPVRHWSVWLARFTFESGFYALYTNFHQANTADTATAGSVPVLDGPRALLVDDSPTASSMVVSLLKRPGREEMHFPARAELDLYDFHFAPFDLAPPMLARRKFMFPPLPSSTSMRRALEREAALHLQGDLVEEPAGLASLRPPPSLTDSAPSDEHRAHESDHSDEPAELAEADISHLDVMIEAMIRDSEAGGRSGDADSSTQREGQQGMAGRPHITELRAAALLRAAHRSSPLQPHRAHHSRPIRGVELDRCYTVEDATAVDEASECKDCYGLHPRLRAIIEQRIAAQTAAQNAVHKAARTVAIEAGLPLPPPPPPIVDPLAPYLTAARLDAGQLYDLIYRVARPLLPIASASGAVPFDFLSADSPRFVLYQPSKAGPFDRHLRGLYFSFLLALLSNRILLVDLPDLHLQYDCPFEGAEWRWSEFSAALKDAPKDVFDSAKSAALRTSSLDDVYTKTLLVHSDMVAQDRVLFKNTMYRAASAALFGSSSRMRRTGEIVRLLLAKPRPALLAAVAETQRAVGLASAKVTLAVHVVVPAAFMGRPVTAADPLPGVPARHWDCVRSFLLAQQLVADGAVIYFTTNRPSALAFALARRELARFGQVVTHPHSWNATVTTGGVSSASSSSSSSSSARHADGSPVIDPALVSGFIMGEVDLAISSGTTYGIFNSARTAFQHRTLIVKLAPPPAKAAAGAATISSEEDYCGPMRRLDLAMQEDITF